MTARYAKSPPNTTRTSQKSVDPKRIYLDHGLTGKNRSRPGLWEALAACHEGSTLVVTKLDRLGRSITDLRDIAAELELAGAALSIGGQVHDRSTPFGRLVFNMFAMMAEFEGDLISQRTREGMAVAEARGRMKGRQPKLTPRQDAALLKMHEEEHDLTIDDLAQTFRVSRASVYRARARSAATSAHTDSS